MATSQLDPGICTTVTSYNWLTRSGYWTLIHLSPVASFIAKFQYWRKKKIWGWGGIILVSHHLTLCSSSCTRWPKTSLLSVSQCSEIFPPFAHQVSGHRTQRTEFHNHSQAHHDARQRPLQAGFTPHRWTSWLKPVNTKQMDGTMAKTNREGIPGSWTGSPSPSFNIFFFLPFKPLCNQANTRHQQTVFHSGGRTWEKKRNSVWELNVLKYFVCFLVVLVSDKNETIWVTFQVDSSYLLLLNPVLNLFGGGHVCPEQADGAGEFWVQDVAVVVSDNQVQIQVPCVSKEQKKRKGWLT